MSHLISTRALQLFGFALTACFAFILFILFQTLYPYDLPVKFGQGFVRAWIGPYNTVVVSYVRPVTPLIDVDDVMLFRSIECDVDGAKQVYDLQPLRRTYRVANPQDVNRLVQYPYPLAVGTKCIMRTQVVWNPEFSWSPHSEWLPEVNFEIDPTFKCVRLDQKKAQEGK